MEGPEVKDDQLDKEGSDIDAEGADEETNQAR